MISSRKLRNLTFSAAALAFVLSLMVVLLLPPGADYPGAEFRAWVVERNGFSSWNSYWYGGHETFGYSVLAPPLSALLGVRATLVLATSATAALFVPLAERHFGARVWPASLWFAVAGVGNAVVGRLPFALGVVFALAALLAWQRQRLLLAVLAAALCSLTSPLAGLFLALCAADVLICDRCSRAALAVSGGALVPVVVLTLLFSDGGTMPFDLAAALATVAALAVSIYLIPPAQRVLRTGVLLYLLLVIAAYVIGTTLGYNVTRLATVYGGPLLACALLAGPTLRGQRVKFLLVVATLAVFTYWQWDAPVDAVIKAHGDRSTEQSYYRPLLERLEREPEVGRIEIPFTLNHWETYYIPHAGIPLARGWERQLDVKRNKLFYTGRHPQQRYCHWLKDKNVRYVALPGVPLDYSAEHEATLIRQGMPCLRKLWRSEHWQLLRVTDP